MFYTVRMDVISMRDLNQNTSEVVREVAATGRSVTITSNGNPIGVQLVPTSRAAGALDELVARGRASSPAVHGTIPMLPEHDTTTDTASALAADRDEERW